MLLVLLIPLLWLAVVAIVMAACRAAAAADRQSADAAGCAFVRHGVSTAGPVRDPRRRSHPHSQHAPPSRALARRVRSHPGRARV